MSRPQVRVTLTSAGFPFAFLFPIASMPVEYRRITDDSFREWRVAVRRAFGDLVHPDDIERARSQRVNMDRLLGAYEDGALVGTGGVDEHTITVPGGAQLPLSGIGYLTTAATHRRRGILRGMMQKLTEDAVDRQEPVAALWAAQSSIYTRFGFGIGSTVESWTIDRAGTAFVKVPTATGRIRFVPADSALSEFAKVYDRVRATRPGFVDRSRSRWLYNFFDDERVRGSWSGLFYVAYETDGRTDGYAIYRTRRPGPEDDFLEMSVIECVAASDEAHAALWRFLFDVDLVRNVAADSRPPDDPVWWMLADPRKLKRWPEDGLWVKLLDPVKALEARAYRHEGGLVLEVNDDSWPPAAGRFRLECSPAGASCRPTSADPDLVLSASELGAVYLGGVKMSDLARAGRVEERRTDALALADMLFAWSPAPWCAHHF